MRQKRPRAERNPTALPEPAATPPRNRLLSSVPPAVLRDLQPHFKTVPLRARQILHKAGEPTTAVYFPNGGVASITSALTDGRMVEVMTVGVEGMVGIEAFFGEMPLAPGDAMIQVSDTDANAEMLAVGEFRRAVARSDAFSTVVGRYAQLTLAQMIQSTACNALHTVQQRCARWLLTTHDRMQHRDFRLSHEFLAVMLGVQRPTVSVVAAAMQESGLIRYRYGRVSIRDRRRLERASCECYGIVRARTASLLG